MANPTTPDLPPYRLQLVCPPDAADTAHTQLLAALGATALDDWFTVLTPVSGSWTLWWDDQRIWHGVTADPRAWEAALLEGWWGAGGGCC